MVEGGEFFGMVEVHEGGGEKDDDKPHSAEESEDGSHNSSTIKVDLNIIRIFTI